MNTGAPHQRTRPRRAHHNYRIDSEATLNEPTELGRRRIPESAFRSRQASVPAATQAPAASPIATRYQPNTPRPRCSSHPTIQRTLATAATNAT